MGVAYYLVNLKVNPKLFISAHSLGGGYKMGEFWQKERIDSMIKWLTSEYGDGWKLMDEYAFDATKGCTNIGYTKQVRTAAVEKEWTNWKDIEHHDNVTLICQTATDLNGNSTRDESDLPPSFKDRYIHREEISVAVVMGTERELLKAGATEDEGNIVITKAQERKAQEMYMKNNPNGPVLLCHGDTVFTKQGHFINNKGIKKKIEEHLNEYMGLLPNLKGTQQFTILPTTGQMPSSYIVFQETEARKIVQARLEHLLKRANKKEKEYKVTIEELKAKLEPASKKRGVDVICLDGATAGVTAPQPKKQKAYVIPEKNDVVSVKGREGSFLVSNVTKMKGRDLLHRAKIKLIDIENPKSGIIEKRAEEITIVKKAVVPKRGDNVRLLRWLDINTPIEFDETIIEKVDGDIATVDTGYQFDITRANYYIRQVRYEYKCYETRS